MASVLVIDVGSSSVRAAVVSRAGSIVAVCNREVLPLAPAPGFVEVDAAAVAEAALAVAREALDQAGPVDAVGITAQRATTVVWDRATGEPIAPAISWQDIRTVGMCLALVEQGVNVAPSASATKLTVLLDLYDTDRGRDLCFGTFDSWLAWTLSRGAIHVTDATNAAVTGLVTLDARGWDDDVLDILRIPRTMMPRITDSSGVVGEASALPGAPPIAALVGDQQASLIGQACLQTGMTKITFGSGGMLDMCVGERPTFERRGPAGTFPIVAWRRDGALTWGIEGFMLSAGTCIQWLRDDLGVIETAADTHTLASSVPDSDGVWFVPALVALGTPHWDYGARGTLLGLTRGSTRAHVVRAVLEGIAHRGADLVDAAEADSGLTIDRLRIDGGMIANPTFVQAVANACQRPVEVAPVAEATTLGAAYLAGQAVGIWKGDDEIAALWEPSIVVEPTRRLDRDRWQEAVARSREWIPELSALHF